MYKKNRCIAALCLAVCMLLMPTLQANAASQDAIMPRMTYISNSDCGLTIEDGVATVDAFVNGNSSLATRCEIEVVLQEKGVLFWNDYASWSDSQSGRRAEIHESIGVNEGEKYRAVVTVTVWSGNDSESREFKTTTVNS